MKCRSGSPSRCEARRAVGQEAEPLLVADRDAAVRPRAQAVHALAALGREQRDDVVAGRDEAAAALADPLDDAGALVPEHAGRVSGRIGPGGRVQVGVADAAGGEPDERLACLRLVELDLLDDERLAELLEDGGPDLHGAERTRQPLAAATGVTGAARCGEATGSGGTPEAQRRIGASQASSARRGRRRPCTPACRSAGRRRRASASSPSPARSGAPSRRGPGRRGRRSTRAPRGRRGATRAAPSRRRRGPARPRPRRRSRRTGPPACR